MLLDLNDEGEHPFETPERPRHAMGLRHSAQRVADVAVTANRGEREREIDEAGINHPSSLPVGERHSSPTQ